jgi:hypothetical protein
MEVNMLLMILIPALASAGIKGWDVLDHEQCVG